MENDELFDFEKWSLLVNKAFTDYQSLSAKEKIWYTVQILIDSVNNGGLISYYYNSGADHINDVMEALKALSALNVYNIVQKINESVFEGNVPNDLIKRNEIIDNANNIDEDLLDQLDQQFFQYEPQLQDDLLKFVNMPE